MCKNFSTFTIFAASITHWIVWPILILQGAFTTLMCPKWYHWLWNLACTLYLQTCQKRNIIPNNKQHTTQIHATRYKVVGSNPAAAKIFYFIWMFNLGIANGAKVGLKLRLSFAFSHPKNWINWYACKYLARNCNLAHIVITSTKFLRS